MKRMSARQPGYRARAGHRQRGFSFFEVMIAALILAIGVLGFAGLQMRALGSTGVAHSRAQAAVLAGELAERIRLQQEGALSLPSTDPRRANDVSMYLNMDWSWSLANKNVPTTPPATWTGSFQCMSLYTFTPGGCTETQLAAYDFREMRFLADQLLPQGNIAVQPCAAVGGLTCVAVAWGGQDSNDCALGDGNANCFVMQVMM